MCKSLNPEENALTIDKVKRRAAKFRRIYKKRLKGQPGRRPDEALFILLAAYSLFKEKYPKGKEFACKVTDWLNENFIQLDPDGKGACFHLKNLYRWQRGKPFKEMQWGITWEAFSIAQKISDNVAAKGQMELRDITRMCSISKQELEDLTGLILTQNVSNKKTSNKFIFDRPA